MRRTPIRAGDTTPSVRRRRCPVSRSGVQPEGQSRVPSSNGRLYFGHMMLSVPSVARVAIHRPAIAAALMILICSAPALGQRAELARARSAYNQQQFDEAIAAALTAQKVGATADAATVVLSRSYLERYRLRANPADLAAARAQLGTVRVSNL